MSELSNTILISHLRPKNILSFGPDNEGIDLKPLNILIGPNGSGKSNLVEIISLMRAATEDLQEVTRKGGGVTEWLWKGMTNELASVEWILTKSNANEAVSHIIFFGVLQQRFILDEEWIVGKYLMQDEEQGRFYYRYNHGHPIVNWQNKPPRQLSPETVSHYRSILSQLSDPESYPDLYWLSTKYKKIRIYREWTFGRNAAFREPQKADMQNDILEEDFSNLGLFLNRIKTKFPVAKRAIISSLRDLYDGITDFEISVEGGTVQVFFTEGDFSIPATRLSDGTLRYLCLLAILCDPEPPPLICIEEPELGLHPDILPKVADLLIAASKRTQLIVTTHSDILVDAMSDMPDAVVVCEKHDGQTTMKRLDPDNLKVWLEKYRLGELWISGEIGGTRW